MKVQDDQKSRRFSKLPPAPRDSPNAKTVGHFEVIPTLKEEKLSTDAADPALVLSPANLIEKSRRFSKLPLLLLHPVIVPMLSSLDQNSQ